MVCSLFVYFLTDSANDIASRKLSKKKSNQTRS